MNKPTNIDPTEKALRDFLVTNSAHFLSFSRERSALHAYLRSVDVTLGDEVIVTGSQRDTQ